MLLGGVAPASDGDDIQVLAWSALARIPQPPKSPMAQAIARVLTRERKGTPRPRPEEVSTLDVRAEMANRVRFLDVGLPYPPRTHADVIAMLHKARREGHSPIVAPEAVAAMGASDAALVVPRLVGYEAHQLCALLARPARCRPQSESGQP